jgi:hypothetical protein
MRVRREKKKRNIEWLNQFTGPCPTCGYRLQRPQTSICPECGSFLQPVLSAPFRFSPWHAMLVSLTVSTGVVFDRLALTIVGSIRNLPAPLAWDFIMISLVPLVVLGVCIYVVWVQKQRFYGIPKWKSVCWYIASICTPVVAVCIHLYLLVFWIMN